MRILFGCEAVTYKGESGPEASICASRVKMSLSFGTQKLENSQRSEFGSADPDFAEKR